MMKSMTLLASGLAALGMAQLAAAAPADVASAGVLRSNEDRGVVNMEAVDAAEVHAEPDADEELDWGSYPLDNFKVYAIKVEGVQSSWRPGSSSFDLGYVKVDGPAANDGRDATSSYAYVDASAHGRAEFLAMYDRAYSMYRFRLMNASDGRSKYLGVQHRYPTDSTGDGGLRLIATTDINAAGMWTVEHDPWDTYSCVLGRSLDPSGRSVEGEGLGVPPHLAARSGTSKYLGLVSSNGDQAVLAFERV